MAPYAPVTFVLNNDMPAMSRHDPAGTPCCSVSHALPIMDTEGLFYSLAISWRNALMRAAQIRSLTVTPRAEWVEKRSLHCP